MPDTVLSCPTCGKRSHVCRCLKRPPVANYTKLLNNRGPERMLGKVVPLQTVTEEDINA